MASLNLSSKTHHMKVANLLRDNFSGDWLVCTCGHEVLLGHHSNFFTVNEDWFQQVRAEHANNVLAFHLGLVID